MIRHNEPMSDYLASDAVSASDLKILLNKSPYHFYNRTKDRDSAALSFGTLAHTAILEPDVYETYIFQPDIDKRTKEWKAWQAENSGKTSISEEDDLKIRTMTNRLKQAGLFKIFSRGQSEVSCYQEVEGIAIRARADKWDPERRIIVDLKTTRDLQWFKKDCYKYGYDLSVPHYTTAFGKELDIAPCDLSYIFVAVESEYPFDCGWFVLSGDNIVSAHAKWSQALEQYRHSFENPFQGFTMPSPTEI